MPSKFSSKNISKLMFGTKEISKAYLGSNEIYNSISTDSYLLFTSDSAFSIAKGADGSCDGVIQYSLDNKTYSDLTTTAVSSGSGKQIYIKNKKGSPNTYVRGGDSTGFFVFTGSNINCSGELSALLDYEKANQIKTITIASIGALKKCFYNCSQLTTIPDLTFNTDITASGTINTIFESMFENCTGITKAVKMTIYGDKDLNYTFKGCTALTDIDHVCLAGTLTCEPGDYIFENCTGLTKIPAVATTDSAAVINGLVGAFKGCTGLFVSETQTSEYRYIYKLPINSVYGTSITISNLFEGTSGTYTGSCTTNTVYYTKTPINYGFLTATCADATKKVCLSLTNYASFNGTCEYSTDLVNWSTLAKSSSTPLTNTVIYVRGKNNTYFTGSSQGVMGIGFYNSEDNVLFTGNIENLLNYESVLINEHPSITTYGLKYLFHNNRKLLIAPNIMLEEAPTGCCQSMFEECTSLTTAPILSATILGYYCYEKMFYKCTSLTSIPALPAMTLASYCYSGMFQGCTSLTTALSLPATILASYCYNTMFSGCTSLTIAPILPATTLTDNCYRSMFNSCTSLTISPSLPATALAQGCYYQMFSGCTSLVTASILPATTLATSCYAQMFDGCTSLTASPSLSATTLAQDCYFSMFNGTNVIPDCSNIDFTNKSIATSGGLHGLFAGTKITDADLNIILPKNSENKYWLPVTDGNISYNQMFENCTLLITAPELPATTLAEQCYNYMFSGCTSLTTAPVLPATNLANYCYCYMFKGCTSLTTAPSLPATTLVNDCYSGMFKNCTSLTTPPILPATTLAQDCYFNMFDGCTSLTTVPSLPATALVSECYYYMFDGCTSLTTVPSLPATNLADRCYLGMFRGCKSLTTVPTLPATILANYCYVSMFANCTSLTAVPELPATELKTGCYNFMFEGCTSLYVSDTSGSGYSKEWKIPTTGTFTNTTTYNQSNMFYSCLGTRSSNTMSGANGESHTYYTND